MRLPSEPRAAISRREIVALFALSAVVVVPAILLRRWWVEDAAIAFSFARNLANGDGLVAYPGGERVEGFSDPLWIALLAVAQLVGLDPFATSKVLGTAFAAACVPVAWAIARRVPVAEHDAAGAPVASWLAPAVPWVAAALVATNAQGAIWANAGLETSLFSLLVALGAWRALVEAETGGAPWSSVAMLAAALTRPEGVAYAGLALAWGAWRDLRARRWRRPVLSALAVAVPYAGYEAARYAYFALPFPLPYYAKLADSGFAPFNWGNRSWTYLRSWAWELGWGFLLPLPVVGIAGARGWRIAVGALWIAALAVALALPETHDVDLARIGLLLAGGVGLPLLSRTSERLLLAALVAMPLAFAYRAGGDWMAGYRFYAPLTVPLAVLVAVGAADLAARLPRRAAYAVVAVAVLVPGVFHGVYVVRYAGKPEPMTPASTRSRVRWYDKLAAKVHLDRPWVAIDHAMGGMTWWGPPSRAVDFYGLTDVPSALHRTSRTFGHGYFLDPPFADFAHLKEGLVKDPLFLQLYVPLPHADDKKPNDWIARSLLTSPSWPGDAHVVAFDGGVTLEGYAVPSPDVAATGGLYVEVGLRADPDVAGDFTVEGFLAPADGGDPTATFDLQPGYDLLPPTAWRADEVFVGRYAVTLPKDLPTGTYDLGFAVFDADGKPRPATSAPPDSRIDGVGGDAGTGVVVASGEVRFPGVVRVLAVDDVRQREEDDWKRADEAVAVGDCGAAEAAWKLARDHEPLAVGRRRDLDARAAAAFPACWAAEAGRAPDLETQVEMLERGRRWDPRSPDVEAAGERIADAQWDAAMAAREAGDEKKAFELFGAIVRAEPSRSWARRYAEDARAVLLAVEDEKKKSKKR